MVSRFCYMHDLLVLYRIEVKIVSSLWSYFTLPSMICIDRWHHQLRKPKMANPCRDWLTRYSQVLTIAGLIQSSTNSYKGLVMIWQREKHLVRAAFCPNSHYKRATCSEALSLFMGLDNCLREFFTWWESHAIFCRDVDGLAISWVHAFARCASAYLKRTESNQTYLVTWM